ncbi:MAG: hypothetical protein ACJ74Z_12230 [Bryobacteraceae bacterium]
MPSNPKPEKPPRALPLGFAVLVPETHSCPTSLFTECAATIRQQVFWADHGLAKIEWPTQDGIEARSRAVPPRMIGQFFQKKIVNPFTLVGTAN